MFRVYASTRQDEMAVTGWSPEQIENFLRMQFQIQHAQYFQNYPDAQFDLILADGVPVGRLYVHRRAKEIRIIDIALLREHRRQGIGGHLMRELLAEADRKGLAVSLHVEHNNPVLVWYERLGFQRSAMNGIYCYMERATAGGPPRLL